MLGNTTCSTCTARTFRGAGTSLSVSYVQSAHPRVGPDWSSMLHHSLARVAFADWVAGRRVHQELADRLFLFAERRASGGLPAADGLGLEHVRRRRHRDSYPDSRHDGAADEDGRLHRYERGRGPHQYGCRQQGCCWRQPQRCRRNMRWGPGDGGGDDGGLLTRRVGNGRHREESIYRACWRG